LLTIGKAGMATTDIEKKSLEAHVELCAERYSALETKLNNLDDRMDKIEGHIVDIKDSLGRVGNEGNKTLITIGTAIFVALLTAVLGVVVHLATK
jgi:prefoldin subunit 5